MVPLVINNLENTFSMKLNQLAGMKKINLLSTCVAFIFLGVISNDARAQQKFFAVNSQQNPLKTFSIPTNKESHPFFIDIDGDGDLDCFSGEYSNAFLAKIYYYRNEGTNKSPVFKLVNGEANPLNKVVANVLSIPFFVDIDGDGDYDCFIGEGNTGAVMYYKNIGDASHPSFQKQSAAFNPLSMAKFSVAGIASPAFADVDGDGDYDCLVVDEDGNENYFKNTGTISRPSFVHAQGGDDPFQAVVADGLYNPSFYDWNHDGLPDLFVNTTYYQNVGTEGKPAFVKTTDRQPFFQNKAPEQFAYTPLRWVDINNDGAVDVFQGDEKGNFVYQTAATENENAVTALPTVHVYPNPSREGFMVNIPSVTAQTYVRITDLQGKLLGTFNANSNTVKFGKDLKAGAYIVQVMQDNKEVFSQKIIKQ